MSKFRFRLLTLLKVREAARDERRARLAEAYLALEKLQQRGASLVVEADQLKQHYFGGQGRGAVDVDQLLSAHRYQMVLAAELQVVVQQQTAVTAEIEKRRQALVAAETEVRVLEKLKEKQYQRHQEEERAIENKRLDEVAQQSSLRRELV